MSSGFTVRFAEERDIPLILRYIHAMAAFVREPDAVTATEEILRDSLFVRHAAEALIGECQGKPVGHAVFCYNFSTFLGRPGIHLEDLYIEPDMRGRGFGKRLVARLAQLTLERDCGRLEWECHAWNEPAMRRYQKWGAELQDDSRVFRLCGDSLHAFVDTDAN